MDNKPKHIFIQEMKKQPDERWTIILSNGRVITNLSFCCNAMEVEMEDSFFYEIYFEKVKNAERDALKNIQAIHGKEEGLRQYNEIKERENGKNISN